MTRDNKSTVTFIGSRIFGPVASVLNDNVGSALHLSVMRSAERPIRRAFDAVSAAR